MISLKRIRQLECHNIGFRELFYFGLSPARKTGRFGLIGITFHTVHGDAPSAVCHTLKIVALPHAHVSLRKAKANMVTSGATGKSKKVSSRTPMSRFLQPYICKRMKSISTRFLQYSKSIHAILITIRFDSLGRDLA